MKHTFKYFLFFLMISIIGSSMYIATLKSTYKIEESYIVKIPVEIVFNEVNDFNNWNKWMPWIKENPEVKINYSENTTGVGSSFTWKNDTYEGSLTTTSVKENEQIIRELSMGSTNNPETYWDFKSVPEGTEVTWGIHGENSFQEKIKWLLRGGIETEIRDHFSHGLQLLDKHLSKKIKEHSFIIKGIDSIPGRYFIYQSTASSFSGIGKKEQKISTDLSDFVTKNALEQIGSPFILYHKLDTVSNTAIYSICMPIRDKMLATFDTILLGYNPPMITYKTILKGDVYYVEKAFKITYESISENGFVPNEIGEPFEIRKIGERNSSNPANWLTEIYIPLK